MFKKILAVLFLSLLSLFFVKPSYASVFSGFFDQETSISNNFSASSLYFSLNDASNNPLNSPLYSTEGILPNDSQVKFIRITKEGNEDFKYDIRFSKISGDDELCNALQIEAKLTGVTQYNGSLSTLLLTPRTISSSGYDDWDLAIKLNDNSSTLHNKTCKFTLTVKGWQKESDGSWGFSDTHSLENNISTGIWTIESPIIDLATNDSAALEDSTESTQIQPPITDTPVLETASEPTPAPTPIPDVITPPLADKPAPTEQVPDSSSADTNQL